MPISKKQNKSRKHFSRINKSKSKLRKNLNDKKNKKTKLQISKLSGGAGLNLNNLKNIDKFTLPEINQKILEFKTEIKRIKKDNPTKVDNKQFLEESGIKVYESYIEKLKEYRQFLKNQPGRISKFFGVKPLVAPRKTMKEIVERNSEPPINAWGETYINFPVKEEPIYNNASAPNESQHPSLPIPFSEYLEKEEKFENKTVEEEPIFGVPSTSTSETSNPNKKQEPAKEPVQEIIYVSSNNVNPQNPNNPNNSIYTVANVNTPIKRLEEFIKLLTSISFCDCKIILLYILAYRLYEDEKQKQQIITLIKQDTIKNSLRKINTVLQYNTNKIDNTYLIWNTLQIIIIILKIKYTGVFKSCSDIKLEDYLNSNTIKDPNKNNYKILFNTVKDEEYENIVNTLSTIFKQGGNFIEGIDIENINGNIFKKSSKKQSLSLAKENYVLEEEDFEA